LLIVLLIQKMHIDIWLKARGAYVYPVNARMKAPNTIRHHFSMLVAN
jgi:hypothetical protein